METNNTNLESFEGILTFFLMSDMREVINWTDSDGNIINNGFVVCKGKDCKIVDDPKEYITDKFSVRNGFKYYDRENFVFDANEELINNNEFEFFKNDKQIKRVSEFVPTYKKASTEEDFQKIFDRELVAIKNVNAETISKNLVRQMDEFEEKLDSVLPSEAKPYLKTKELIIQFKEWLKVQSLNNASDNKNIESIVRLEFERERKRFTNNEAFEKAITETVRFFANNNHRCKTPISQTKTAKDAIISVHKAIKVKTGRTNLHTYEEDADYNSFIQSLYTMYANKTDSKIGETMSKKK